MDLTVAVIAKECLPGRVKTRLSPPLTPEQAAALAQLSLSRTLYSVRSLPARRRLLVMDGAPTARDATKFTLVQQVSGGLDERLAAICDATSGPLLIIGMDTPQFSRRHVEPLLQDWSASQPRHDAWMGPATDGGFWSLALRQPDGALIRGVPMSTTTTGARQLARLTAAGLNVGMLPELRDMDHFSDAQQIAAEIPGSAFAKAVAKTVACVSGVRQNGSTPVMTATAAPAAYFGQGEREPFALALLTGSGALTLRPESAHYPAEPVEFDVRNWCEDADATERSLLQSLLGPVLDVGCGPGRLLAAAQLLGLAALGIDASAEAVRQARNRGARVLEQSIFAPVPQPGHWQSVILLDGNIGIGSVTALLGRCRQLIAPSGTLLVEVDADENIDTAYSAFLEDRHGNRSEAFAWARIGTTGLASRAPAAGWSVAAIQRLQGRVFCRLSPRRMPVRSIP